MNQLFEYGDIINNPIECFYFNSETECFPVRAHWHYYMEIIYMLTGVATITVDSNIYLVSPGDLILFHPQSVHAINADAPVCYAVLKFDINVMNLFQGSSLKLRNIFRNAKANDMPVFFPSGTLTGCDIAVSFRKCIEEIHQQSYGNNQLIQCKISELLIEVIRITQKRRHNRFSIHYHPAFPCIYFIGNFPLKITTCSP